MWRILSKALTFGIGITTVILARAANTRTNFKVSSIVNVKFMNRWICSGSQLFVYIVTDTGRSIEPVKGYKQRLQSNTSSQGSEKGAKVSIFLGPRNRVGSTFLLNKKLVTQKQLLWKRIYEGIYFLECKRTKIVQYLVPHGIRTEKLRGHGPPAAPRLREPCLRVVSYKTECFKPPCF